MANKLVTVIKSDNVSKVFRLNTDDHLDKCRAVLTTQHKFMTADEDFLLDSTPIERSQESDIPLSELIGTEDGPAKLYIGCLTPDLGEDPDRTVQNYNQFNDLQKRALFSQIQILRGLTLGPDGFRQTDNNLYLWRAAPAANKPRAVQEIENRYAFSKATLELTKYSVDKASVELDTPYGGGNAEYEYEKSKTTTRSKVTEHLLSKFIVRKIELVVQPQDLQIDSRFETAVRNAVVGHENVIDGYADLLDVLNEWGYYIPTRFTLGGMIYASDSTEISDFSEAETEKQKFGGSFKAKVKDIGGGASYERSQGSEQTTTTSNKYQAINLQQIGGLPGIIETADQNAAFGEWAESLDSARNWDIACYDRLVPSLQLLGDKSLQGACIGLINRFRSYPAALQRQPVIHMGKYATVIQSAGGNPYG